MNIVVDAMGGDYAPGVVVDGAVQAVKELNVPITLIGIKEQVEAELKKYSYPPNMITVLHAPEVVGMHDPAITPIRKKRNSSITLGIDLLKDQKYDAFVSAGNTGACVAAATINLGLLPGVERPAIGIVIPTLKGFALLIDAGANTEPKSEHLLQFAQMGTVYVREVMDIAEPKVGLLNIGAEEGKGSGFEKETYKLMEEKLSNFSGNVEANEVYSGKAECVVCDGFVGNVVLKVSEGLLESVGALIKREVKKDPLALLGALLMKSRLKNIKKMADYSEYGGAPLLGVNGIVMIGHGRSNAKAIKNAIRATMREVEHDILAAVGKEISKTQNQVHT